MTDYRKKYKTKSTTAIARIKELEKSNAYLAKEASELARKNVELEKENTSLRCESEHYERLNRSSTMVGAGLKEAIRIMIDEVKND